MTENTLPPPVLHDAIAEQSAMDAAQVQELNNSNRHKKALTLLGATVAGSLAGTALSYGAAQLLLPEHASEDNIALNLEVAPTVPPTSTIDLNETAPVLPIQEIAIDCSKTDYELPTLLEANTAKEAVSHIEFFIDDPSQIVQVRNSISESTSVQEVQQIVDAVFAPRGVQLLFDQVPQGLQFNPNDIDLVTYQNYMTNFVEAYGRLPAKIGQISPTVYITNGLYAVNEHEDASTTSKDEYQPVGGLSFSGSVAFDINSFGYYPSALGVINHELLHEADAKTCRVPNSDETYDTAYYELRQENPLTQVDLGFDGATAINATTATPEELAEIAQVVADPYGLSNDAEDKATSINPLVVGNFPDADDADFNPDSILYRKQELMVGRLAEALGIPELAQYYAFTDIYGPYIHPNTVIQNDISPYQADMLSRRFAGQDYSYMNTEFNNIFTPVQVTLANGSVETFYVSTDQKGGGQGLSVSVKVDGVNTDCSTVPEVQELSKLTTDIIRYLSGDASLTQQQLQVTAVEGSPDKINCVIDTYSITV